MAALNNDTADLQPRTTFDGPVLEFDFPAFQIGVAEYDEGPTGCTVFYFPEGAMIAADVRGGAVGQFMVEEHMYRKAICLAGGSLYGLEAATGVAAELLAQADYSKDFWDIAPVAGACVYDFGFRQNSIYPDKALGRAALKAAKSGSIPLRQRGAGVMATVGKAAGGLKAERGGQGAAFAQVGDVKIASFVVTNAMGAIHGRDGNVVRGNIDRKTGERRPIADDLATTAAAPVTENTTLSVVVTNQQLNRQEVQVGRQVHASMGRMIQPFHTGEDGDTLFTVTTNEVRDESMNATKLATLASELMWDAVLASFDPES
jgi:L-aminopeptidase/D-esterase-like protein